MGTHHTPEMKPKVERGKWAPGVRPRYKGEHYKIVAHFWPADHPMSLCGTMAQQGNEDAVRRCINCTKSYERIMQLKLAPIRATPFHPIINLRVAVTDLVDSMREWMKRERAVTQGWMGREAGTDWADVMVQALWLINLAGVPNSGVPLGTSAKVLTLMRDLAKAKIHPEHALELMKGWECGQAD